METVNNKLLNFNASENTNLFTIWNVEDFLKCEEIAKNTPQLTENIDENYNNNNNNNKNNKMLFKPRFSHQIFKDENIIGYDPLRLSIYFGAGTLYTLLDTNYTLKSRNITNVEKEYIKLFSKTDPLAPNKDIYLDYLEEKEDRFTPPGTLFHEYSYIDRDTQEEHKFEVYHGRITEGSVERYHEKCQIFVLWFIDGSSYIHTDDPNWDLFFIFEKKQINGKPRYGFTGYCTLYNFYHHPSLNRCRISQFLILPTYQRQGHGKQLLNSIYRYFKINDSVYGKVYDITVEDPCDEFSQLRNYVDLSNILEEGYFKDVSLDLKADNKELFEKIRKNLLITTVQAKVCLEIYLYSKFMNKPLDDTLYKQFRIQVKKKLYKQFIGDTQMGEIVEKQSDKAATTQQIDPKLVEEKKLSTIIDLYKTVEEDYIQTINSIGLKIHGSYNSSI